MCRCTSHRSSTGRGGIRTTRPTIGRLTPAPSCRASSGAPALCCQLALGLGSLRLARRQHRHRCQQVEPHQRQPRTRSRPTSGRSIRRIEARFPTRTRRRARSTAKPTGKRQRTRISAASTRATLTARKSKRRLKDTDHGAIKDKRGDGAEMQNRKDKGAKLPSSRDLPKAGDRKRSGNFRSRRRQETFARGF